MPGPAGPVGPGGPIGPSAPPLPPPPAMIQLLLTNVLSLAEGIYIEFFKKYYA